MWKKSKNVKKWKSPEDVMDDFYQHMTPPPQQNQKMCDVCGTRLTVQEVGFPLSAQEFRNIVQLGFAPPLYAKSMMTPRMVGISNEQFIEEWKKELVEKSPSPLFLCIACAIRANEYRKKTTNAL